MNARKNAYHTEPQEFDEVIYTPYSYQHTPRETGRPSVVGDLLGQPDLFSTTETHAETDDKEKKKRSRFDGVGEENPKSEVFIFEYGVVVIWGMTVTEERRFLSSL
jgi:uncharacterized Rmd1/YagE family protein